MLNLKDSLVSRLPKMERRIADERRLSLVGGFEPESFNSWPEMEHHLETKFGLESASICLLQDLVGSESTATLGRLSACEMEMSSMLIEVSVGYRLRLAIHLVGSVGENGAAIRLPAQPEYRSIARCATTVFSRFVSDQVVGLMSDRSNKNVAWFYLNGEAHVAFASSEAAAFCQASFADISPGDTYFSPAVSRYLTETVRGLVAEQKFTDTRSLAFAIDGGNSVVHCLLRVVTPDGLLLSMCRDV